jgi:serine/threonine protein kinase
VFKGRHEHMSRIVALKMIRKERLSNPETVRRFYQEVQAAAQLHHPNIVMAYDAGPVGSAHYFAMEYVEGCDLAHLVAEKGALPPAEACEYIRQAALGLQHAHEKGLVHRDIKPHNLLLTQTTAGQPLVKVLDMGLVRLKGQSDTDLTQPGQVLGTPAYVAPEQAFDSRTVDQRSDLYSLGCTLYFLLTGRPPFVADMTLQVLLMHQKETPVLELPGGELPGGLREVVLKLMAKKPDDRYPSAAEAAAALEPFARGEAGLPVALPTRPARRTDEDGMFTPPPERSSSSKEERSHDSRNRGEGRTASRKAGENTTSHGEPEATRDAKTQDRAPKKDRTAVYLFLGAGLTVALLAGLLVVAVVLFVRLPKPGKAPSPPLASSTPEATKPPAGSSLVVGTGSPDSGATGSGVVPGVEGSIYAVSAEAAQAGRITRTRMIGVNQHPFEEMTGGALVVGLEVGLDRVSWPEPLHSKFGGRDRDRGKRPPQEIIHSIRPIFQTAAGRTRGTTQGKGSRTVILEAREGYALGSITLRQGMVGVEGLSATFVAVEGQHLNPARSYTSEWVGTKSEGATTTVGGDGAPVIGIFGSCNAKKTVCGLGLVVVRAMGTSLVPGTGEKH